MALVTNVKSPTPSPSTKLAEELTPPVYKLEKGKLAENNPNEFLKQQGYIFRVITEDDLFHQGKRR